MGFAVHYSVIPAISALPVELAAATEMLDEERQDLPQDPTNINVYTFSRIGEHNIVCLLARWAPILLLQSRVK